jgi:hypothetical protein
MCAILGVVELHHIYEAPVLGIIFLADLTLGLASIREVRLVYSLFPINIAA